MAATKQHKKTARTKPQTPQSIEVMPTATQENEEEKQGQTFRPATVEMFKLMQQGMDAKNAILLAKGESNPTDRTLQYARANFRKWSLSSPKMQKLAHDAIKETLKLKPLTTDAGDKIYPSHTNRIAAAAMVADRTEPVVRQNLNVNANIDVSPVDLSRWRNHKTELD